MVFPVNAGAAGDVGGGLEVVLGRIQIVGLLLGLYHAHTMVAVLGSIHIVGLLLGLYHAHVGGGLEVVLGSIPGSWNKGTLQ